MQKLSRVAMCLATVERCSFNVSLLHTFLVGFYLERKLEEFRSRFELPRSQSTQSLCFFYGFFFPVGSLDTKLLESILQRAKRESQ